jgi:acetyl esterase/lipase
MSGLALRAAARLVQNALGGEGRMRRSLAVLGCAFACATGVAMADEKPAPSFADIVKMRVVYSVPGMDQIAARRDLVYRTVGERSLKMDVYPPAGLRDGERRPAVVFVHGGPIPPDISPKSWGGYRSYGELVAASGMVGVTFDHRFYGAKEIQDAADDVAALLAHVRANAATLGIDADRVAIWVFSGGGAFLSQPIRETPAWVRCLVSYYAALDNRTPRVGVPNAISDEVRLAFSPAAHVAASAGKLPPILIARAGRDDAHLNASVDSFVREAIAANAPLELITHPSGRHGFDILDDDARSREILARTIEFLRTHLDLR